MGAAELGRYRLKRVLRRGAMGEVWEAQDVELGRRVAVKIMHTTDDELALARTRFGREARVAAVLRHPNIVVVHDAGEVAGTCFMVMELVEGKPLRSLIAAPDVPLEDKLRWIREIGDALAAMHEAGIVHRDVKPDNIIIRADGTACLVDFGIAKWTRQEAAATVELNAIEETADDVIVGTPDYLPPETRDTGVSDEKSDQYAWAVTAYELLAGVHPEDVNGRSLKERADIPQPIIETIEKARSKLPSDRFGSIEEAVDGLVIPPASAKALADVTTAAPPRAPMEPPSNLPFLAIGVLAVLAVGATAIVLFALMQKPPPTPKIEPPPPPSATTSDSPTETKEAPSDAFPH